MNCGCFLTSGRDMFPAMSKPQPLLADPGMGSMPMPFGKSVYHSRAWIVSYLSNLMFASVGM